MNPRARHALEELQQKQAAERMAVYLVHEGKEIRAIQRLAHKLFGDSGFIEMHPNQPGAMAMGYYTDRKPARQLPGQPINLHRERKILFFGTTYKEFFDQSRSYAFNS